MSANTANPKITVGILCYNAEDTIQRAIESALSQDHKDFEIIVLDDASTDSSLSKVNPFISNSTIRLIRHQTNKGPGAARNTVINAAKGEFVVFFDDDDVSRPQRLTIQQDTILANEKRFKTSNIACFASGRRIYPNGYTVMAPAIGSAGTSPPNGIGMAKYLLAFVRKKGWFYGAGTPASGLMIKRELLIDVGGFDPTLRRVEDVDLAVRLALSGTYFVGSSEQLLERYMTHANDKSPLSNLAAEQKLVCKYKEFLSTEGLFYHAYNWHELRYRHFNKEYIRFICILVSLFVRNPIRTIFHLFATGPQRIIHELQINA